MFREKCFEDYFAMVLQQPHSNGIATVYSGRNYSFQESFEGKRLCNNNFRFTEKQIPFCHETITIMQRFNLEKLPNPFSSNGYYETQLSSLTHSTPVSPFWNFGTDVC
jgi:hypothetical protein